MFTTQHETFLNLQEAAEALGMRTSALVKHPQVHKLGSKKGDEWRFLASRCADFLLEPTMRETRSASKPSKQGREPLVYTRGRAWYAHLDIEGRRVRRSLGECASEEEARERAYKLQFQLNASGSLNGLRLTHPELRDSQDTSTAYTRQ